MKQLIDKDVLVKEIEKRVEEHKETLKNCDSSISEMILKGSMSAYQSLLHFLGTIEVKEVDLEKSISDWLFEGLPNDEEEIDYIKETAKHFFELGLKAQKGK